jgi:hypothetical protein
VVFIPVAVAALAARGRAALLGLAGVAWIALVALMSEAGFSGEPRYVVPGAALVAVSGAAGCATLFRRLVVPPGTSPGTPGYPTPATRWSALPAAAAPATALLALFLVALPHAAGRAEDIAELPPRLAHQADLAQDLENAIAKAGGREAVLRCGTPYVGPLRGTHLAYRLRVPKRTVEFDPRDRGVVFRSRLTPTSRPAPRPPRGYRTVARTGTWRILADCA